MAKKSSSTASGATTTVQPAEEKQSATAATTKQTAFRSVVNAVLVGLLAVAAALLLYRWSGESSSNVVDDFAGHDYPFALRTLKGRGKGLIATRLIKEGERIITEAPLFTLSTKVRVAPEVVVEEQLRTLSSADRARYMRLADAGLHADPRVSIFQTNAVALGERGAGVCPTFARLNHACLSAFNAVYSWQEDNGVIVVHATKDIKPGQELLTTYTDTLVPKRDRQSYLKQTYNFTCACAACSRSQAENDASDARMREHAELMERFASWGRGAITGSEATRVGRRIYDLRYNEEHYTSTRGQLLADLAQIAAAHQSREATLQWSEAAAKYFKIEVGSDNQRFKEVVKVLTFGVTGHPHWGTRVKEHIDGPGSGVL